MLVDQLPDEVLSLILSNLELATLYRCHLVCKHWREVGRTDALLRRACVNLGLLEANSYLGDLATTSRLPPPTDERRLGDGHRHSAFELSGRDASDAASYEQLLKSSLILRKIKSPPELTSVDLEPAPPCLQGVVKGYSNHADESESDIWRIKLDPIDNVLITSGAKGGLTVLDLESGQELWREADVKQYAHVEFSEGYVVHDRDGLDEQGRETHFQVWKFERLVKDPDEARRGMLVPAGTITSPFSPRAFRLIWPHLAVASATKVAVFDVTTGELVEQFEMSQPTQPDWGVLYIEMDEQHIFVLRATVRGGQRDGLYVYERMKGGRELWSPLAPPFLRSQIIWTAEGRQMDFLRYDGEPLQSCSTLGFAQQLMPATCEDQDLYERTDWCNAVHVDTRTGTLCLAGDQGGLMVIPDYKEAFRRPCPASSPSEEEPQPGIPTIGVGADISRSIYPYLAVADGIAAFTCAADSLPVWIDLEKLICSRHNEDIDCEASEVILPTLSTFYPGDPLLMDCCGYDFTGAQCMQIDARQLVMTCRTMTDVETGRFGGFRYQSRSIALRLDLGDILKAKLAQPSQPFETEAYQTRVHFPRRTAAQEAEKASWRRLQEQDPEVKLHLPSSDFISRADWLAGRMPIGMEVEREEEEEEEEEDEEDEEEAGESGESEGDAD